MSVVLIFIWVDPRAMVRLEGNMSMKNPVTPPGIDPGTVRLGMTMRRRRSINFFSWPQYCMVCDSVTSPYTCLHIVGRCYCTLHMFLQSLFVAPTASQFSQGWQNIHMEGLFVVSLWTQGLVFANNQLETLFSCIYLFQLATCFEHHSAHHQEIEPY